MLKFVIHFSIRLYWKGTWLRRKRCVVGKSENTPARLLADSCKDAIHRLADSRGKSTLENYQTALRSLLTYTGDDIGVGQLSQSLMEGYQHWLLEQGVTLNTVSCYMRSLRALLGHVETTVPVEHIFKNVFKGKSQTDKRSLPLGDIQALRQLPLAEGTALCLARDLFLFSVCALGMPFVDVAFLRKSQISDGYITYCRHKTGQRVRVKIERPAQQIIDRYSRENRDFVFPILREGTMSEYHIMRNRYNRWLRVLECRAGLSRHLTSYVARHSWASLAYQQNVDLSVISKAMGHTSTKTTLVYIREIDDNRIDTANHDLLEEMMKGV